MLIKIATNKDQESWDNFVSNHPEASPYHRFAWKIAIESSYSHKCYYLIAEDSDGNIAGVLPTVLIKPPIASAQLCSLPFCDRGEALFINQDAEQALVDKANDIAVTHHAIYEYRASQRINVGDNKEISNGSKVRMLLELPETSELLMSSFKAKLRSQIRKAEKNGLTFEVGRERKLIDEFYHVFTINMKDLGSPTHSKKWFEQILENYRQNMIISIVRYNDIAVGAGIVLLNGKVATIPWASTKREFNKLAPNMLLYWSLLEYSTDQGYQEFDFGRSSFGEGTFKFKRQWGAQAVPLDWQTYENKQLLSQQSHSSQKSNIRSAIENIWCRLPLPMTVAVGSRIRKYISL